MILRVTLLSATWNATNKYDTKLEVNVSTSFLINDSLEDSAV